jgi:helicase MOV-10
MQDVVEGVRPPEMNAMPYVGKLPKATIPSHLASVLSSSRVAAKVAPMIKRHFMPSALNADTYSRWFKQLLWAEEHQAEYVQSSTMHLNLDTNIYLQT